MTANPSIKIKINRVYRGVDYSLELGVHEIESVEELGVLMQQAERFIDRILDAMPMKVEAAASNQMEVKDYESERGEEREERQRVK